MKNPTLALLSASAMALPAISNAATAPANNAQISVSVSQYEEDNIDSADLFFGAEERYDIDISQFSLTLPLGSRWQVDADMVIDEMSGASPWYVFDLGDGPLQAMSGASIEDKREDISIGVTHFSDPQQQQGKAIDAWSLSANLLSSEEDDYDAKGIALGAEWETDKRHRTWSAGWSYSNDKIDATDADIFTGRPSGVKKYASEWVFGLTQIIDRVSIAQVTVGHKRQRGYLSDPYKLAQVGFLLLQDNRPDERTATHLVAGYKRHWKDWTATTTIDYRFFSDDWGIDSHTLKLSWWQSIGDHWALIPSARWYKQSAADFYALTFAEDAESGHYSSDYRLSGFNANAYGLEIRFDYRDWTVSVYGERYRSGDSNLLGSEANNAPGLVDFDLATLGISYRF